jgi:hypothetical protein
MIYSSRNILELRSHLLAISSEQWLLMAMGLIVGCVVWMRFNRRIVQKVTNRLRERTFTANAIAAVEGVIGVTVFLVNASLVYLATLLANFFLFSFAVTGVLVGAWITIPASFE